MPSQTRQHRHAELAGLINLFRSEGVRSYLEIGARRGDSFNMIMRSLPVGSRGHAVDLPGGAWGTDDTRWLLRQTVTRLISDGYCCDVIFGASQSESVKLQIEQRSPFDAILIDADHRYEAVAADWWIYRAFGRIVAFHDIAGVGVVDPASGFPVEVPRLWGELKAQHRHMEIVAPDSSLGIGVVYP